MTLTKITDAEIGALKVASLPSRPTAPRSFGGAGYTAKQMKEAFDRLPMFIISRFNELIDALSGEGESGVASAIPSGILEEHSLADALADVTTGAFADYLTVLGLPLSDTVTALKESIRTLEAGTTLSSEELQGTIDRIEGVEALVEEQSLTIDTLAGSVSETRASIEALAASHASELEALRQDMLSPTGITIDCGGPEGLA